MKSTALLILASTLFVSFPCSAAKPAPETLVSSPQDRHNIEALLTTYTQAVSTKDTKLFETILLNKDIPLSYIDQDSSKVAQNGTANYESFRKGIVESHPFTQTFKNVNIEQDGNLASVRLIFVNTDAKSSSWGWKTLQLLKVNGMWKIASEFYTVH